MSGATPSQGFDLPPAGELWREAKSGLRQAWPSVVLVLFVAYFDLRTNGQFLVTFLFVLLAVAPIVLRTTVTPLVRSGAQRLGAGVDPRLRTLLFSAAPIALFYLVRLRGDQSAGWAILTMALPLAMIFLLQHNRERLHQPLAGWYEFRDRSLPTAARIAILIAVPLLLAFIWVHGGGLGNFKSLFWQRTETSTLVQTATWKIPAVAVISGVVGFLLMDPGPRKTQS